MKPKLKKDYFSVPKDTICNVLMSGTQFVLQNAITGDKFAVLKTKEDLDEFI